MTNALDAVKVKDYSETIPRFIFSGKSPRECCYVRLNVSNNILVVLCAQLLKYPGTPVTNAFEEIFHAVFLHLWGKNIFEFNIPKKSLGSIFGRHSEKRVKLAAWRYFMSNTIWIEHYPAGTGLAPEGSYAIVENGASDPTWRFVTVEEAAKQANVNLDFLTVKIQNLTYEHREQ